MARAASGVPSRRLLARAERAPADEPEGEASSGGRRAHEWYLPFEASKAQLAALGSWQQQLGMVALVGLPVAAVYYWLVRRPTALRRALCTY